MPGAPATRTDRAGNQPAAEDAVDPDEFRIANEVLTAALRYRQQRLMGTP